MNWVETLFNGGPTCAEPIMKNDSRGSWIGRRVSVYGRTLTVIQEFAETQIIVCEDVVACPDCWGHHRYTYFADSVKTIQ